MSLTRIVSTNEYKKNWMMERRRNGAMEDERQLPWLNTADTIPEISIGEPAATYCPHYTGGSSSGIMCAGSSYASSLLNLRGDVIRVLELSGGRYSYPGPQRYTWGGLLVDVPLLLNHPPPPPPSLPSHMPMISGGGKPGYLGRRGGR
jgi:hypothetical protein